MAYNSEEVSVELENEIHPAFLKFIEICAQINFGKIECLQIQNGLPVFVETSEGIITLPGAKIIKKHKLT